MYSTARDFGHFAWPRRPTQGTSIAVCQPSPARQQRWSAGRPWPCHEAIYARMVPVPGGWFVSPVRRVRLRRRDTQDQPSSHRDGKQRSATFSNVAGSPYLAIQPVQASCEKKFQPISEKVNRKRVSPTSATPAWRCLRSATSRLRTRRRRVFDLQIHAKGFSSFV